MSLFCFAECEMLTLPSFNHPSRLQCLIGVLSQFSLLRMSLVGVSVGTDGIMGLYTKLNYTVFFHNEYIGTLQSCTSQILYINFNIKALKIFLES